MTTLHRAPFPLAFALLLAGAAIDTAAQPFTVDPARSSVTMSGTVQTLLGSVPLQQQGPGSLTATYRGTLYAEPTATTIRFPGGSQVIADNSGSWQPKTDATAGSEPANYGVRATPLLTTALAAIRNLQADAVSPELPLVNGTFDSRGVTVVFLTNANATISYLVTGLINESGAAPLSGAATNSSSASATITTLGDQQTLTIPVDTTFYLTLSTTNDTTVRLQGQFVATRTRATPVTVGLTVSNQTATLRWESSPGQTFSVFASPNLGQWQAVATNVTSAGNVYTWSEAVSGAPRFYRVAR